MGAGHHQAFKLNGKIRRLLRAIELERRVNTQLDTKGELLPCRCTQEFDVILKSLEPPIAICTNCDGIL